MNKHFMFSKRKKLHKTKMSIKKFNGQTKLVKLTKYYKIELMC